MLLATKLIDTDALLNVVWVSFAAAAGGTAAFSLAIVGATRFSDMRREGHAAEAALFAVVAVAALAVCAGAIVLGLYAIIDK